MSQGWEGGGHRPRVRVGAPLLAVLAVLVVAGGLWWGLRPAPGLVVRSEDGIAAVASETPDALHVAPNAAADQWLCPSAHPVRASGDGRYYPSHYPRRAGAVVSTDRCYADADQAEGAGYTLAPPPPDAVLAGGLYLVRPVAPTSSGCRTLAADAGFTVPCPTRLPSPAIGPECSGRRCVYRGGVIIEQRGYGFTLPDGWCDDCKPHTVITAARGDAPRQLLACDAEQAIPPSDIREPAFVLCPAGDTRLLGSGRYPHAGHTAVAFRRGVLTVVVSVEGDGAAQREALTAIVDGIELIDPPTP